MKLTIQAYHNETAFDDLRPEWDELMADSARPNIFTTWVWQSNWWAAYQPGQLWIIALRDSDQRLLGLAPWFIHADHPKGRLVRAVGCVDVSDYLELILRQGHEAEVLAALTEYVKSEAARYDMLDFCNIPQDAPMLQYWPAALEAAGYRLRIEQQEVCPVIALPQDFDSYLEALDKKQRHEVRRKIRKAEGAAKVEWAYVGADADIEAELARFMALMRTSSPDKAAFLDDPQHYAFFTRIIPEMARCGWLLMSFLQFDGQDVAAYISFDYDNRILLYNSGFNSASFPDLSPGIVLLTYLIKDAINQGRSEFDFLRGNEIYKYRMGGEDRPVLMLNARLS